MKSILKKTVFSLGLASLVLSGSISDASAASKEVKLLFPEPYTSASTYAEGQAVGMYYGALDFNMQNHPTLRGKYKMRWVGDIIKSPADALGAVATGAGEITYTLPQFIEQFDPEWGIITAPGVFNSWEHFLRAMETPEWQAKQKELEDSRGFKILKWTNSIGNFWLWTKKGPADSLESIKGQRIRFAGQKSYAKALDALDVVSVALPYTEVVSALQTNMIDGLTNDIFGYTYYDLPRLTEFMVPIPFGMVPQALVVNAQWWNSLPEKEREVIAFTVDAIDVGSYFDRRQDEIIEWWDENPETTLVKMTPEAEQAWRDAVKQSSQEFLKDMDPSLLKAIDSVK